MAEYSDGEDVYDITIEGLGAMVQGIMPAEVSQEYYNSLSPGQRRGAIIAFLQDRSGEPVQLNTHQDVMALSPGAYKVIAFGDSPSHRVVFRLSVRDSRVRTQSTGVSGDVPAIEPVPLARTSEVNLEFNDYLSANPINRDDSVDTQSTAETEPSGARRIKRNKKKRSTRTKKRTIRSKKRSTRSKKQTTRTKRRSTRTKKRPIRSKKRSSHR